MESGKQHIKCLRRPRRITIQGAAPEQTFFIGGTCLGRGMGAEPMPEDYSAQFARTGGHQPRKEDAAGLFVFFGGDEPLGPQGNESWKPLGGEAVSQAPRPRWRPPQGSSPGTSGARPGEARRPRRPGWPRETSGPARGRCRASPGRSPRSRVLARRSPVGRGSRRARGRRARRRRTRGRARRAIGGWSFQPCAFIGSTARELRLFFSGRGMR